jgi:predicted TPR repeat methyltransferase
MSTSEYWNQRYGATSPAERSWTSVDLEPSMRLIHEFCERVDAPLADIGGGTGDLGTALIRDGFSDVTVMDIASSQYHEVADLAGLAFVQADVRTWRPTTTFATWHDRAVFHFLVTAEDVEAYLATLRHATATNAIVIIGTFALDGPETCSGLPVQRYDETTLAAVFGAEWSVLHTERHAHTTPWGTLQSFQWLVLRRVTAP